MLYIFSICILFLRIKQLWFWYWKMQWVDCFGFEMFFTAQQVKESDRWPQWIWMIFSLSIFWPQTMALKQIFSRAIWINWQLCRKKLPSIKMTTKMLSTLMEHVENDDLMRKFFAVNDKLLWELLRGNSHLMMLRQLHATQLFCFFVSIFWRSVNFYSLCY